jgi:hypothetical protein
LWHKILRDVLSPIVGLGIEIHEVVFAPNPREAAIVVGLLLIGIPVDAAARLVGRQILAESSEQPPAESSPTGQHSSR